MALVGPTRQLHVCSHCGQDLADGVCELAPAEPGSWASPPDTFPNALTGVLSMWKLPSAWKENTPAWM